MKKFIGVIIILLTLLLTVIYRQLAGSRVKDKPGQACVVEPGSGGAPGAGGDGVPGSGSAGVAEQGFAGMPEPRHKCALHRLREELPLFQLLIQ